jgi:hypothetical protein
MVLSKKLAQITTYYVGGQSTYSNINMRTVMGAEDFELGAKYNLVLRAQMNDISNPLTEAQSANRFLVSSNMMRFQNYETAVGKQASSLQMVTYASFPMFYYDTLTCNTQISNVSNICTFTLESEVGYFTVQAQNQIDNSLEGILYPNYLLIFDIYKCA